MNKATSLVNSWMGVKDAVNDGSFQPNLDWYGPFLSVADRYGPFLPNVRDTMLMASYVDEAKPKGLKDLSLRLMGYEQVTYDQVVTKTYAKSAWDGTGKLQREWDDSVTQGEDESGCPVVIGTVPMVSVRHKMCELSATEVFDYGCDDTICTAALANHFAMVLEIEDTDEVWDQVETYPAYLTSQAFVDGVDFSHESMRAQEKDDDAAYDAAWVIVRKYLIEKGFDGTVTPKVVPGPEYKRLCDEAGEKDLEEYIPFTNKGMQQIVKIVDDREFTYEGKRVGSHTPSKWAKVMLAEDYNQALALAVERSDLDMINKIVADHYDGEPRLDLGSPKQAARLLYDVMGLPINIVNDATDIEKKFNKPLYSALMNHRNYRMGKGGPLGPQQKALIRKKAKADDDAIAYAIAFDTDVVDDYIKSVLKAYGTMKSIYTRRNLYYTNYWPIKHWKTGKIHSSVRQCQAMTRRYSMANPNLQQLPKKGEAVRFRAHFRPHKKNAVIASIDFAGQELRLAAFVSQDPNMLACYIGEHLKDIHSITAAGAMRLKWGDAVVDEYFRAYGEDLNRSDDHHYILFMRLLKDSNTPEKVRKQADDLRKASKNVNFAAQFGGQALKLSETLIMKVSDAQLFLTARSEMFPLVDKCASDKQRECLVLGYAQTLMGARRHLHEAINSPDRQEASRAARQAWNMWIQGSAAEMTKLGMSRFWLSGAIYRFDVKFIAPIHDELVTSVAIEDAPLFLRIKHWCMTQKYANMDVPVLGSISLGENFADQLECGDDYDEEAITDATASVLEAAARGLKSKDCFSMIREGRKAGLVPKASIEILVKTLSEGGKLKDAINSLSTTA